MFKFQLKSEAIVYNTDFFQFIFWVNLSTIYIYLGKNLRRNGTYPFSWTSPQGDNIFGQHGGCWRVAGEIGPLAMYTITHGGKYFIHELLILSLYKLDFGNSFEYWPWSRRQKIQIRRWVTWQFSRKILH